MKLNIRALHALSPAMLLVVLSACSTSPYQPSPPVVSAPPVEERADLPPQPEVTQSQPLPQPEMTQTTPQPAQQPRNPALIALLDDAERARQQGDYRASQNTLQRAQRIAPRDADVYYDLASTHLALEDFDLAEQVALKGVSLVQGNAVQLRRFWRLIATIRLRAGDARGAREAEDKADSY